MACETPTTIEKGLQGENSLNIWFQENGISFFPIKQSPETFAHFFRDNTKRPDYFVLLESISMFGVDAKYCNLYNGYFGMDKEELRRALIFEMVTRMPFWFAFLHQGNGDRVWYWINALRAMEAGEIKTNKYTGEDFLAISLKNFIPVRNQNDLGLLFTRRSKSAPNLMVSCSRSQ